TGDFTCPNRDGTKSYNGCIYCNNDSFTPITAIHKNSIKKQIQDAIYHFKKRYKAKKFLAYFQSYTNTYADISYLRKVYYEALSVKDVVGIAIGTRPDCVNDEVLDLLNEIGEKYHLWLELGLQSIHNKSLEYINRCDTFENFVKVYNKARIRKNIHISTHLIHGLPTESVEDMLESTRIVADMGIDGIKFHQLHIVKNTLMEKMYYEGKVKLPSLNEYLDILGKSLLLLPKDIIIQRLFGLSNPDILVAPKWSIKKENLTKLVDDYLLDNEIYQGKSGYNTNNL
ncbi:MAG: TIGR01212 family radical SAM protein, partial [Spirochaetota bacterium]